MASPVAPQEVVHFLELVNTLATNQSTIWIDQVLKENKEMKATAEQDKDDHDALTRTIARLTSSLDKEIETSKHAITLSTEAKAKADELATEVDSAQKTIADKDQKLQEADATIADLKKSMEVFRAEVKARDDNIRDLETRLANDDAHIKKLEGVLEKTEGKLKATAGQLKELQDLSANMVDMPKEAVLTEINKVYDRAKDIALRYFAVDLSEEAFKYIEEIRHYKSIKPLHLRPSNSPYAKRARVAVFLSVLGCRLADQIFVPFYLPPDEDQATTTGPDAVTLLLSRISEVDQKRQLQLRSLLLAVSPDDQRKVAQSRADHISRDISRLLGGLLSDDRRAEFKTEVTELCRLAVTTWETLRVAKSNIEPFAWTHEITKELWLAAELDADSPNTAQTNGNQHANGKQHTLTLKPSLQSLKSDNGLIVVWPGFSYSTEVLKRGFMLLDSQVRDKDSDEDLVPSRRKQRAMKRAATTPFPVQSQQTPIRIQ